MTSPKVKKLRVSNQRYRYLLPEEEPRLMAALDGPRAHLKAAVIVALGTGMRLGEQLCLRKRQVDFLRNMVTPTETKNGKDRDIPLNVEVRAAFVELCNNKSGDDYVFTSPKTDGRLKEVKKGFKTALRIAGIERLRWHDLRGYIRHKAWRSRLQCLHCRAVDGSLGYSDDRSVCERHRAQ